MTTTDPLALKIAKLREPLGTLAREQLDEITAEVERLRAERDEARALLREAQAYVLPDDERARRLTDRIDAALREVEK